MSTTVCLPPTLERMHRLAVVPLLLVLACGACGGEDPPSGSPSEDPPAEPGPGTESAAATTPACEAVRAGIDAFNAGDYDETVDLFTEAVPLAEEQLDGSPQAEQLLEAVEWYAALPAEDYPEAAATSPEFQRYKDITLTQCDPAPDGGAPSSPPPVEA